MANCATYFLELIRLTLDAFVLEMTVVEFLREWFDVVGDAGVREAIETNKWPSYVKAQAVEN